MEQAPVPRGSPQAPQAPTGEVEATEPFVATANTESLGINFLLSHLGHSAFWLPYTRASNSWLHFWQTYSKIGMIWLQPSNLFSLYRIRRWKPRRCQAVFNQGAACAEDMSNLSPVSFLPGKLTCPRPKPGW